MRGLDELLGREAGTSPPSCSLPIPQFENESRGEWNVGEAWPLLSGRYFLHLQQSKLTPALLSLSVGVSFNRVLRRVACVRSAKGLTLADFEEMQD